mmetsp:Transcript_76401/g.212236  ORF Transcript_76401/g.212236 Transcript_76401/m.212236 type:complete len:203 (+) Transcript_76401:227-835(+)
MPKDVDLRLDSLLDRARKMVASDPLAVGVAIASAKRRHVRQQHIDVAGHAVPQRLHLLAFLLEGGVPWFVSPRPRASVNSNASHLHDFVDQDPHAGSREAVESRARGLVMPRPIRPELVPITFVHDHVVVAGHNDFDRVLLPPEPGRKAPHLFEGAEARKVPSVHKHVAHRQPRQLVVLVVGVGQTDEADGPLWIVHLPRRI